MTGTTIAEDFTLDLVHRELLHRGRPVPLGGRAFDLLAALAAADGAPVSVARLMDQVWPGISVSPGNLRVQVNSLRKVLGRDAVEHVQGIGYRLVLPAAAVSPFSPEGPALVGRGDDIARLEEMLAASRLVSIVGPGAVGKTCLAHDIWSRHPADQRLHVELAPVRRAGLVAPLVAAALSVRLAGPDILSALGAAIGDRPLLLLIDNAEHLLDEVGELADGLLALCPRLQLLLTSREALAIGGETVYRLCPLACPPEDMTDPDQIAAYPAVQLVLDRRRQAGQPPLEPRCLTALAALCRRLDGLPLALQLLAARLNEGTSADLTRILDGAFNPLPLPGPAGYRHESLQRALDWSYDLLSDAEQLLLRRLTVFLGPFSWAAAMAVCAGPPLSAATAAPLLASLVRRSLVAAPTAARSSRLFMLETVREYVLEVGPPIDSLTGELARWLDACFLAEAEWRPADALPAGTAAPQLADIPDLRQALSWCFEAGGDPGLGQRLTIHGFRLLNQAGLYTESTRNLCLSQDHVSASTPPSLRAVLELLIHGEGSALPIAAHGNRRAFAADGLRQALNIVRGPDVPTCWRYHGILNGAWAARHARELVTAESLFREAAELAAGHGRQAEAANALTMAALMRSDQRDFDAARVQFAQALEWLGQAGASRALTLLRLAEMEFAANAAARAIALAREILSGPAPLAPGLRQTVLGNLASYLLAQGQDAEAVGPALEAVRITRRQNYAYALPWTVERAALIAIRRGDRTFGRTLARLGETLVQQAGIIRQNTERQIHRLLSDALAATAADDNQMKDLCPPPTDEFPAPLDRIEAYYEGISPS